MMLTTQDAIRLAVVAQVLIRGCMANRQVQAMVTDGSLSADRLQVDPIVRVEYEHAHAIGCIGETLGATSSKNWGDGPFIVPLQPGDQFHSERITFIHHADAPQAKRYQQRQYLKNRLRQNRGLVGLAMKHGKAEFLRRISAEQETAIRHLCPPDEFWRAVRGKPTTFKHQQRTMF